MISIGTEKLFNNYQEYNVKIWFKNVDFDHEFDCTCLHNGKNFDIKARYGFQGYIQASIIFYTYYSTGNNQLNYSGGTLIPLLEQGSYHTGIFLPTADNAELTLDRLQE